MSRVRVNQVLELIVCIAEWRNGGTRGDLPGDSNLGFWGPRQDKPFCPRCGLVLICPPL